MPEKALCHKLDLFKKSLELGLKPIVVINKIDRPSADFEKIERTHAEILDLFLELGANEEQINFETVYAIGKQGRAFKNIEDFSADDNSGDLSPLLDVILEKIPSANLCQRPSLTNVSKTVFDTTDEKCLLKFLI